jgi:hypothetical protein
MWPRTGDDPMTILAPALRHRLTLLFVALFCQSASLAGPAWAVDLFDGATRLVMVDDAGCVYCAKWDKEVRQGYEASPEGRFAPLVRLRIGSADLAGLGQLAYTPTFVLIVRGKEAGRIVGYGGNEGFWSQIDRLYPKAGFRRDVVPVPPTETRASLMQPPTLRIAAASDGLGN